jgi:uncharacterized protein (UPF0262 family)
LANGRIISLHFSNNSKAAEIERAAKDILKENIFSVKDFSGDVSLSISVEDQKYFFCASDIKSDNKAELCWKIPHRSLRSLFRDYQVVCDSYLSAIRDAQAMRVEAIDMGRRGLHDEGAEIIQDACLEYVSMNHETARKIFSLLYEIWRR